MSKPLSKKEKETKRWFDSQVAINRTKTSLFVELHEQGMKIGEISRVTGNHYSFVYGAVDTNSTVAKKETNKSDLIRQLADDHKTVGEIARLTNSNYSWVHRVVKKHKHG